MALDQFAVGDRVRMAEWVKPEHLRVLGISERNTIIWLLSAELVVVCGEDGAYRSCGRVIQVDNGIRMPLFVKCCYLRRVDGRSIS
jgi:hypothetical protein